MFHDAYQYFEKRFGLKPGRAITISPETPPSARRVSSVATAIRKENIGCIFSEPQFNPKLVRAIAAKSGVHSGVIDPLGANIPNGPMLYKTLLTDMADALIGCVKKLQN